MATFRTLECLVALVDCGSVTKAAARLHMSQPALSHQIAALERELGTAVVERLPRGVRVTAAGRATADEARAALRSAERAVQVGRRAALGETGQLRIGCVETMTAWLLVPLFRQWRSRHPDVRMSLSEYTSADEMIAAMAEQAVDVAVGPEPSATPEDSVVLGQEDMLVVGPAHHPFRAKSAVPIQALGGQPFVHYDPTNGMAAWVDHLAARYDLRLDPVLRTRSPRTAAQLAAAGMGITVVPASALVSHPAGTVRRLRPAITRDILAMMGAPSDALVQHFVDDLRTRGLPTTPSF
jgi:DNA-binding transcriptional LysR family regulator